MNLVLDFDATYFRLTTDFIAIGDINSSFVFVFFMLCKEVVIAIT